MPEPARRMRSKRNTVHLGKTGTATDYLLLEIGWLSQRFAALSEQWWAKGPVNNLIYFVSGQVSVRNGEAGRPAAFERFAAGIQSLQP